MPPHLDEVELLAVLETVLETFLYGAHTFGSLYFEGS
jgi:hypothetical protein